MFSKAFITAPGTHSRESNHNHVYQKMVKNKEHDRAQKPQKHVFQHPSCLI